MYSAKLFSMAFGLSLLAIAVAAPQGKSKIPKPETRLHARDDDTIQGSGPLKIRDDDEIIPRDDEIVPRGLFCCSELVPVGSVCDPKC